MEMIKERRKSYPYIVFALVVVLTFAIIVVVKYFNLQREYYKLMQEHYSSEEVLEK